MKNKLPLFMPLFLSCLLLGWVKADITATVSRDDYKNFIKDEMRWREKRDKEMRSPDSWLTIAGLYWLKEGENSFGTDPGNKIVLPQDSAPLFAGKFIFHKKITTVVAQPEVNLKIQDIPISRKILNKGDSKEPDIIALNDLRMWVIKRSGKYAIRLRDLNSSAYKNYNNLDFFPPSEKYKIIADFIPYSSSKKITVNTKIGTKTQMSSPGYVKFKIKGQEFQLEAFSGGLKTLFFIFKDETNGKDTYEASRFMQAKLLEEEKVVLNFNRAYNPPCAFTPYATCPLPPPQNHLEIRIEAGEKKYPGKVINKLK